MPKFKLLRNKKLPASPQGRPWGSVTIRSKYPFANMDVGDCFHVGEYSKRAMTNILTSASHSYYAKTEGWIYEARKVETELFIWRVQ